MAALSPPQCSDDQFGSCIPAQSPNVQLEPPDTWEHWGGALFDQQESDKAILSFSGDKIEVWGWQMMGGQGTEGNSSCIVDGEPLPNNTALNTKGSSTASMLFNKAGLSPGSHTLTVRNGGVRLTLSYFMVQATVTPAPTTEKTHSSTAPQTIATSQTTSTPSASNNPPLTGISQSTAPSLGVESASIKTSTVYTTQNGTVVTLISSIIVVPTEVSTGPGLANIASSTVTTSPNASTYGTTAGSDSHESGHSTPLIAATATASALFLLIIIAGVWLYKKRLRRKDTVTVFHLEPTKRTPQQEDMVERSEKGRFSPTPSIAPTLPEYGYTSHDIELMRGSDMERPEDHPAVEDLNESPPYVGPLVPLRMENMADAESD